MRRMKGVMRKLAREGAAIILSSHLLDLVEEVCTHLLILKNGEKMADGTVAEVHARFSDGSQLSLEDVFFRATGDSESTSPP
jgi:ABC-2 type transport system ATP-binding protein